MTPDEINRFAFGGYPSWQRSGIRCETAEPGRVTVRWPYDATQLSRRRLYGTVRLWVGGATDRTVSHATGSYSLPAPSPDAT